MSKQESIGIVGAYGDLGRQMAVQATSAYSEVFLYDIPKVSPVSSLQGIDSELSAETLNNRPQIANNLGELVELSDIVHWCAPISGLEDLEKIDEDTTLILHDSVMQNSIEASTDLKQCINVLGTIAIVHCLVNNPNTVVVASDSLGANLAWNHFITLGLSPIYKTVKEHDTAMAQSQGVFALNILRHYADLKQLQSIGLLTQSSLEFLHAMEARVSRWTPVTLKAILSNPELNASPQVTLVEIDDFISEHYH